MKWKPDDWVCVIRVKRLLTALWPDLCSVHKTLFHGLHLHTSLTWQVLLDVKCLALLPNMMRYRKAKASLLSGHWDHPPGLACSLSSPLSPKSLSLCEPAPSVGRESWPLFPLCPLTPCVHPHLSVYTSCPEQAGHISLGNVSWGAVLTEEPHSHPSLLFKATEVRKSITHHPLSLAHPLAPSAKSLCCFGFFFFFN